MFSVLVIRLRSLRLLRVSGIVMRLRMFLLLITFLKASHSFRNRLLVICKNAYLFATMIMTRDRKSGSAGMPRPISYAVFCLKKKKRARGLLDLIVLNIGMDLGMRSPTLFAMLETMVCV